MGVEDLMKRGITGVDVVNALAEYLGKEYEVVSLDFQTMSTLSFEDEPAFVAAFAEELLDSAETFPEGTEAQFLEFVEGTARINSLNALFRVIKSWCGKMDRGVVLIIDEVDTATNNQVFPAFQRIRTIAHTVDVPLVLHGQNGSGDAGKAHRAGSAEAAA